MKLPWFQLAALDGTLKLLKLGHNLQLGTLNKNPVIAFGRIVRAAHKVWIASLQISIFKMRQLPLTLPESIVTLGILFQQ